ncbi:MASE3 domain-containing protein [Bacillus sp. 1NLA3E]|uniref:MASE3 domain-containing protein n=1 Tax=Bacillus sp. 1NLA3E TaxID=666686 RepID=UPI000327F8C6|nr:MASE3 domain-containing protein [Bacillus sp. 1NLA3E]AGK52500.1 extracellular exochitinase [Bacillus sp. 1NLA3E]
MKEMIKLWTPNTFERKILLYAVSGTLLFVLFHFYFLDIFPTYIPKFYTSFHIILEFFSISISIAIFTYGWKVFSYTKSRRLILLSFIFFTIGILDLLHTLSFKEMPYFITEGSINNSIWFWLVSRLTASIFVTIILLIPDKRMKRDPRFLLFFISIVYISLVAQTIFAFEDKLPLVVIERIGTTPLKNGIEYFVSFLYLASMVINFVHYKKTKKTSSLYILLSFYFLLISELIFTMYRSVYDFDNFTGHIFKVIGYFFIMKGFYFSAISEDKIAEEKIRRARQELDDIIREQQGLIFIFRKRGNEFFHTLCNGELLYKMGLDPKKIRKQKLEEVLPSNAEHLLHYYNLAWNSGEKVTFEMDYHDLSLFFSLKPIFLDGQVVEVIGSATDITKVKHMEELIRSSEKLGVLGELAAGIAHEVRNPLTTLKGFLQLIKTDISEQNQTYVNIMLEEVDRIELITNEFMAVAKPQALHYKSENITTIINQVVALLQPQAIMNNIEIIIHKQEQLNPVIICEKNHLKQVFINLIKNAFEAMPKGGTLMIKIGQEDSNYIHIDFIDTGIGISNETLKKLGEPFFTLKEGGNGLGLMMCKKMIESHQGELKVSSKLGIGTTFKIILPIHRAFE